MSCNLLVPVVVYLSESVLQIVIYPIQNEARKLNHQEVVEEDRRKKLPKNFDVKRKRVEWEQAEEEKRKASLGTLICYFHSTSVGEGILVFKSSSGWLFLQCSAG